MTTPANGYQFTLLGNAVDGGSVETKFKWGITVHGSHYGSIKDNVVYNYNGASIATEDGSESFNVFDHNFALRGIGEPSNAVSEARMAMGTEGVGFWFRGPNNYVKNNVAANFQNPTDGSRLWLCLPVPRTGQHRGAEFQGRAWRGPVHDPERQQPADPAIREQRSVWGDAGRVHASGGSSSLDPQPSANAQESLIKDLKLWHIYNKTVYMYPAPEGHVRRADDPGQLQRERPVLRPRRLLRGLFVERASSSAMPISRA